MHRVEEWDTTKISYKLAWALDYTHIGWQAEVDCFGYTRESNDVRELSQWMHLGPAERAKL